MFELLSSDHPNLENGLLLIMLDLGALSLFLIRFFLFGFIAYLLSFDF